MYSQKCTDGWVRDEITLYLPDFPAGHLWSNLHRNFSSMKRKRLKDTDTDFSAICNDSGTMEMILKDINEWARQEGLKGFEIAKAIHLESDPFSVNF